VANQNGAEVRLANQVVNHVSGAFCKASLDYWMVRLDTWASCQLGIGVVWKENFRL
jgi:hypothetical protein